MELNYKLVIPQDLNDGDELFKLKDIFHKQTVT